MDILLNIIVGLINLLLDIGEITISIIRFIFSLLKKSIKLFYATLDYIKTRSLRLKENLVLFAKKPILKRRKKRKVKEIKIFPAPSGIKIKYFIIGTFFSLILVFFPLLFVIFIQELPNPKQLGLQLAPLTTKIYDRNGTLLYQFYASQNRTAIPLSSIPKYLKEATIAVEDKNFYKNSGFDILAIIRAGIADLSGQPLQGGSTITQQLIKSTLLTPEITIKRKVKEIILAFWAEKIYSKDQILEMYFNQIPYGGTAWGAEAASEVYFNKQTKDLDLAESAFLAGLTRAPTIYSPFTESPNLWKKRQKEVLEKMVQLKYITPSQKKEEEEKEVVFDEQKVPINAPHFVMYVKELLVEEYGLGMVEKGGLKVTTTLDMQTQDMVQGIVTSEVEKNEYLNLTNGAALVTDPKNGDILAMVGSRDYSYDNIGNFNVTTSIRQPGSSIKPVTYAAALSHGYTASTILDDNPITYNFPGSPAYSPVNYDGKFRGQISLRQALGNSINIPAIKVLSKIGLPTMIDLARKMGITTWQDSSSYGLSITLGGADVKMTDMSTVYGVFANEGYRVDLNPILKLTDSQGNVLEEKTDSLDTKKLVLDPGISFIISDILADNKAREMGFGSNSPLNIPNHKVSVKTGTSDNKRDNWTIGYTPNYVVAVWVGNNDNSPMSPNLASGISGAAPIWNSIMTNLISNSRDERTTIPSNIVRKNCLGRDEYFLKSTENSVSCNPIPTPTRIKNN